jgi:murein tripeptide amidase MpaA
VYLSYNVHGNEAVCTEAAMATAEALATTHSHLLERAVVVMDPCVNPDGRDR